MFRDQREKFSLPDGVHYLNAAYMSPLLRSVEEAGIAGIRRKRFPGDIGAGDFFAGADALRGRFARLLGAAEPARVAILPAVSYGVAVAARNAPVERGQNIVIAAGQFPSNALAWQRLARERGAELRVVPAPERARGRSAEWNARLLDVIDPATAVVALAPVHWTDGTVFDLVAIGRAAREAGAVYVIDGTQGVGARPFDLGAVQPDALVCATYKWLMGPYSLALGWFGPRFDGGVPLEEAWLARSRSDDFRKLVDYVEEYRPAAARYDVGGRSNFVLVPMAVAGIDQVMEWGVERIAGHCREITRPLFEALEGTGYEVDDPDGRADHLFGVRTPPGTDLEDLRSALERSGIHVSLRGSAVRVSPHVYNDHADIDALAGALLGAATTA